MKFPHASNILYDYERATENREARNEYVPGTDWTPSQHADLQKRLRSEMYERRGRS